MAHDLDSGLLRAFVTVIEAGSVSTAANRLARTQAAISMALRRLEEDVGQRLLDRSPRGVRPTDAGRLLLPYAQRILGAAADARRILAGRQIEGAVRLGLIEDVAVGRLPHALRRFSAAYPQVSLEIAVDYSMALATKLANGGLDLVIGDREAFAAVPVLAWQRRQHWVGARNLVLDLEAGVPLVAFENCSWQQAAFAVLGVARIPWRIVCTSTSLLAIQSAVEAGLGLAVLLDATINPDTMRIVGQAEGLPPVPQAEFGLYVAEAPTPEPAVAALRAFLIEELAS